MATPLPRVQPADHPPHTVARQEDEADHTAYAHPMTSHMLRSEADQEHHKNPGDIDTPYTFSRRIVTCHSLPEEAVVLLGIRHGRWLGSGWFGWGAGNLIEQRLDL